MASQISAYGERAAHLDRSIWMKLGFVAATASVAAVLMVEALAVALWPEITGFQPLDSYLRAAIFTLVPALGATVLFVLLSERRSQPVRTFLTIAAIVLLLSFIPDYLLPLPGKTLLASTVAAALHLVAAIVITAVLIIGYRRCAGRAA
jgi:hypothetical protein